jgi:hypothetical protein
MKSYLYLLTLIGLSVTFFATQNHLKRYWSIFFLAWLIAASGFAVLFVTSLITELNLRQWRKEAATINPEQIDRTTIEGQRQWLVLLYARRDYQEAAKYASTLADEVLLLAPCESLADRVKRRQPEVARRLYQAAIEYHRWEGRQATGSGEGLMAMDAMKRVEQKLKGLTTKKKKEH